MEEPMVVNRGDDLIDLPPGFRFHPTDEEIITHYLTKKVLDSNFTACAIGEADLNKCEPWDLPKKAKMGEKEFYFFCQKDRKYPTGMRTNRATDSGYWKATGKDKEIYRGKNLVGMKKTLVFYKGRAPKGEKTNWVMHEYRLEGKFSYYNLPRAAKEEWVVSRIFNKTTGIKKGPEHGMLNYSPLPPLMDSPYNSSGPSTSYANNSEFKAMIDHHSMDTNYQYHMPTPSANNYFANNDTNTNINSNGIIIPSNNSVNPMFYPQLQTLFSYPTPPNLHQAAGTSSSPVPEFANPGYGNPAATALKVDQYSSNKSMVSVSQDTGISTDMNTNTTAEISSANSKEDNIGSSSGLFDQGLRCAPTSVGPISDILEYSWDY